LKGWYTDRNGGTQWDFVNGRMSERKVILYAQDVEANCTAQPHHLELKVENRLIKQTCVAAGRFITKLKNPKVRVSLCWVVFTGKRWRKLDV